MNPKSTGNQIHLGNRTTRGSERNSARKARTAAGVGAAGVPRLTRRIPFRAGYGWDSALERSFAVTSTIGTTRS